MCGILPVLFQKMNFKLKRRLSDVLPNQQNHQKKRYKSWSVARRQVMRQFTRNLDRLGFLKKNPNFCPLPTHCVLSNTRTNHAPISIDQQVQYSQGHTFFIFFFINLTTYSRWTSSLPSCLWSLRIFPSLSPVHALRFFIAMQVQQLVNQWLNFILHTHVLHAFRYTEERTQILFW